MIAENEAGRAVCRDCWRPWAAETIDAAMSEAGQKLTREDLIAALKDEHGIDVADLQARPTATSRPSSCSARPPSAPRSWSGARRRTAMGETDAELALAAVTADLVESIALARAAELAAVLPGHDPGPPRPPTWGLTPTQLHLAANRDEITPVRKGAKKWCGFCGNTREDQLEPGADQQNFKTPDDWLCKDEHERACHARHSRRFAPDPGKVPSALMKVAGDYDAARAARQAAQQQQARPRPAA